MDRCHFGFRYGFVCEEDLLAEGDFVVMQNDIGNQYSPLVIVSPIRGAEHIKKPYPVIVFVEKGAGGLDKKSVVQCDLIKSLDKSRIMRKRGHFSGDIMENVDIALKTSLALS